MTKATNGNGNGAVKREYQTPEGTVLQCRPISSYTLQHNNVIRARSKPLPPMITTYFNNDPNMPMVEANENDPAYKQKLLVWAQEGTEDAMAIIVRLGVTNEPAPEFVALYRELYPEIEAKEVKIHWVYSLLGGDEDEVTRFIEFVTGQTAVTDKGLEQAKENFQGAD
jgi:hypothetical protein